ncbi:MAG: hypothetical protein IKJ94_01795 [Oscillospiraceae bacterium]|nr:hypothetical protein [Oscillospiraceae bacterium]
MKNKLLTLLLSLGISIALWFYVVTVVSPNSDKHFNNIPVTIQSEVVLQERGLMITSTELPKVSLHLEGNRSDLNKLNSANITVSADVSRIGEPGTHNLVLTPTFPGDVPNNAISVLSRTPSVITVEVEYRVTKEVPVDIQYSGTLPENYMADKENNELDFEKITVIGPKSVVDQIAMARIAVDVNGRTESFSEQFQYSLLDAKEQPVDAALVITNADAVNLTMKIYRVKEIALNVTVVDGGGASQATSKITIDPQTIRISGSNSLLEGLESLELGAINLAEIYEDTVLTFPIKLPEGVNNETGVQEATVKIEFPELGTKTLTATRFEAVDVPAGLAVDFVTKQLEIQVRGPKDVVSQLEPSDVKVVVSFANEQAGTAKVKAEIVVAKEGVGAMGSYEVTATLRQTA